MHRIHWEWLGLLEPIFGTELTVSLGLWLILKRAVRLLMRKSLRLVENSRLGVCLGSARRAGRPRSIGVSMERRPLALRGGVGFVLRLGT